MILEINKNFNTGKSADESWAVLSNIDMVVKCLPGAEISEKKSDTEFLGKMNVKMGPVSLTMGGEATITEMDPVKKTMSLKGAAKDAKGNGNATLDMTLHLSEDEDCMVFCKSNININGKLVQYGSRLIQSATNSVFDKFVVNFKHVLDDNHEKVQSTLGVGSVVKGMFSNLIKE